jgi:hypothetical protein
VTKNQNTKALNAKKQNQLNLFSDGKHLFGTIANGASGSFVLQRPLLVRLRVDGLGGHAESTQTQARELVEIGLRGR